MLRDQLDPAAAIRHAETVCLDSGKTNRTPCWICGRPIRYARAAVHRLIGVADGGDPTDPDNLVPAHRSCAPVPNSRRW
ncbi:MAG: hypothetical protein DLM60_19670 [Pseudonocardiales bacterium]|nr:MAG: hypothetical protein DLM60_19670 [Pseudonocardiales bacterium]